MKRIVCILLSALLLLCAVGCREQAPAPAADDTQWITFEPYTGTVVGDTNGVLFEYAYVHPVVNAGSAARSINTKLDNATTAYIYGSGGVQELTELARANSGRSWFVPYALERRVSVTRADSRVMGFRYADYSFTGGLVGSTTEYAVTYDAATGQQLAFGDLTDDEAGLRAYCHACLLAILGAEEYADFPFLPNYAANLNTVLNNWALTPMGLEFIANPYVLTSQDWGVLRLTVPYADLEGMLRDKYLPEDRPGSGSLGLGITGSDTAFTFTDSGDRVVIHVTGTVYDFSVESVTDVTVGEETHRRLNGQYLYSPALTDKSIALTIPTVGSTPDTVIRCCSGNGSEYQFYIAKTDKGFELVKLDAPLMRK